MDEKISLLASTITAPRIIINDALDDALKVLDERLEMLSSALAVEYVGPGVGMRDMAAEHVYRLVVRYHLWDTTRSGWGLKVCDALPNGMMRPMWPIYGVGRLRKQQLIRALPDFFQGYLEAVEAAGKDQEPAGRALYALAEDLSCLSAGAV
ncbi:hypothetical protein [Acidihalobacter prosperus]